MSVTSEGAEKNTTLGLDILIHPHTLTEEKTYFIQLCDNIHLNFHIWTTVQYLTTGYMTTDTQQENLA